MGSSFGSNQNTFQALFQRADVIEICSQAIQEALLGHTRIVALPKKSIMNNDADKMDKKIKVAGISIVGILGIEGNGVNGTFFLGFPEETFLKIYGNMLEENPTEISNENKDLAGELLNIAFGILSSQLFKIGYALEASLPKVVMGPELVDLMKNIGQDSLTIPFKIGTNILYLEIFYCDREKM
jgi:CheY-specific phosphatase CheX